MLKFLTVSLSFAISAYAAPNMGDAIADGASAGLGSVGIWLILGILIAIAFAFITRKK